jgi:hypothetical protein
MLVGLGHDHLSLIGKEGWRPPACLSDFGLMIVAGSWFGSTGWEGREERRPTAHVQFNLWSKVKK